MSMVVALALMVIGIVAFAIGVVANSSAWILVSIVATATAGVVLFAIHRLDRRRPVPSPVAHAASPVPAPPLVESDPVEGRLFAPPARDPSAFPIEGYDDLRVAEILPLLPRLDATQLAVVRGRETMSKRRATILARVDELAIGSSVPDDGAGPPGDAPAAPDGFPIPGYGSLRVIDIVPLLRALDPDQLAAVAQREREGARRQTILSRVDDLLAARVRVDGLRPDN